MPADVDPVDAAVAQPVRQGARRRRGPLEAGVRGRVLALVEDRREGARRARLGWCSAPSVSATQCAGQESTKSGCSAKWSPGSTWWSRVATTVVVAVVAGRAAPRSAGRPRRRRRPPASRPRRSRSARRPRSVRWSRRPPAHSFGAYGLSSCPCSSRYAVSITGSPRDILSASSGSSARERTCRSRAASSGSSPTISPRGHQRHQQIAVVVVAGRRARRCRSARARRSRRRSAGAGRTCGRRR